MSKTIAFVTTKKERFGYYSYFSGQNMIYMLVTIMLSLYYTNFLGIPALIVGNILLGARVLDAILDPTLSILIEKSNLRKGKFKPWINAVVILMPIATLSLFTFTDALNQAPLTLRIVYAAVTYVIWGIIYTASDAPAFALATVMTHQPEERDIIISLSRLTGMCGAMLSMVGGSLILSKTGNQWFLTAGIISALAFLFLLPVRSVKERISIKGNSPSLRDILKSVFMNKNLMVFMISLILANGTNFGMTITPFLASDVFKNPDATSLIMLISFIPILITAPLVPMLIRKLGKKQLFILSLSGVIATSVVIYFVGYQNIGIFYALSFVKGFLWGPSVIAASLFFADCIEYEFYTNGNRFEAATFAASTFSNKITAAMAGAFGMWALAAIGYVASTAGHAVTQTASVINGMWAVYVLGPAVGSLIAVVIFAKFYDLTDEKVKMMSEVNVRKLSEVSEA